MQNPYEWVDIFKEELAQEITFFDGWLAVA